jgi:5-methylcytosine-specific restriction endonuclease McrA
MRTYRRSAPEKFKGYEKTRRAKDPEATKEREKKRHIVRRALLVRARERGTHTPTQWMKLCALYEFKCLCCGAVGLEVTKDHVIPLGDDQCSDGLENLQPLCFSCNGRKNDSHIDYRPDKGEFARSLMK